MPVNTFTYLPQINPAGEKMFRVRTAQYGDGYAQSVADGINNAVQSWQLAFVGNDATIGLVKTFLDGQAGYLSFYWTPPLGVQGYYRCMAYSLTPMGAGWNQLNCTFQEAFNP